MELSIQSTDMHQIRAQVLEPLVVCPELGELEGAAQEEGPGEQEGGEIGPILGAESATGSLQRPLARTTGDANGSS